MHTAPINYAPRHRVQPTLHRRLLPILAALLALFAMSAAAGWRLAGEVTSDHLTFTAALPSGSAVKVFLVAAIAAVVARRATWS